jgi:hypothetical protein
MRENVKFVNQNIEKHAVLLYITDDELNELNKRLRKDPEKSPIDFTKKRLRRVFSNESWYQVGRLYCGWWQNIPREYRHYIRINDKDVVELDYSGLHINILYALENLSIPDGDAYELKGYPKDKILRNFIKFMAQALINASNREEARKALHKAVHYDKTLDLPKEIVSTKQENIYPLMDAFEQKHDGLKDNFCSGRGIYLQNYDAKIAEKILLHFSKKSVSTILPLHDSFILHHGFEDELKGVMDNAFLDMFNKKIEVDLKYSSIIERRKQRNKIEVLRSNDMNLEEILKEEDKYGTYFKLLEEHRSLEQRT